MSLPLNMIPRFFDEHVCFANYAESGERADTFIKAGRLKKALTQMKEGDSSLQYLWDGVYQKKTL